MYGTPETNLKNQVYVGCHFYELKTSRKEADLCLGKPVEHDKHDVPWKGLLGEGMAQEATPRASGMRSRPVFQPGC